MYDKSVYYNKIRDVLNKGQIWNTFSLPTPRNNASRDVYMYVHFVIT